ncbi:hypothetical protein FAIPA1_150093 [Frankia sp. AiPs1]|uniref:hypothetical protein n=1 Tax=Frankia sp. AiPa1 TaxID=573492 RepID=UPI00202AE6FA|nr:hypothetical protein [Frankia sp. AiPa1]MCL9759220.1 hypothetical protein [Frankia sp. AiPa1]
MPDNDPSDRQKIEALIAINGLTLNPAEVEALVAAYPTARATVDLLYATPGVRYEVPAMTYDPRV